jgi:hypothetical protein
VTVDVRFDCKPRPMTVLTIELVSSVGSINVLIKLSRPRVVETSCAEEMYPADPNPVTVDTRLLVVKLPPPTVPKAVEKEEIAAVIDEVMEAVET